jgi:hypothetical protein
MWHDSLNLRTGQSHNAYENLAPEAYECHLITSSRQAALSQSYPNSLRWNKAGAYLTYETAVKSILLFKFQV